MRRVLGERDAIVFTEGHGRRLFRVSADGGMAKVVRAVDSKIGETRFSSPFILPGRETALIAVGSTTGNLIAVVSVESGRRRLVSQQGLYPRYLPEGFLVFVRGASLLAAPFDASTGSLSGAAEPFVDDVRTEIGTGMAQFAFSNTGCSSTPPEATCRPGRSDGLTVAGRSTAAHPGGSLWPSQISPDGRLLATELVSGAQSDIWLYDLETQRFQRLTTDGAARVWAPDSRRIAFWSGTPGAYKVIVKSIDGSKPDEEVSVGDAVQMPEAWSHDGSICSFGGWLLPPRTIWRTSTSNATTRCVRSSNRASTSRSPRSLTTAAGWRTSDESGRDEVSSTIS